MDAILNLVQEPMSDNDFQNAQIQKALLDLNKEIGSINTSITNLTEGLKDNSRKVQKEAENMQESINNVKEQVDALTLKAKYWKFGICFVLACGSIMASIVHFGNESIQLFKHLFGGK